MTKLRSLHTLWVLMALICILFASLAVSACGEEKQAGETAIEAEPEPEPLTVPPRKDDVVVFIRGNEVWAINPNNGSSFQVTDDGRPKAGPRLSPDGDWVLYYLPGTDGSPAAGIFRVPLAEKAVSEQLRPTGAWPAWSTDGKHIAYVTKHPASDNQGADDIAVISTLSPDSSEEVITDHSQVVDMGGLLAVERLEYSPDGGEYIYFIRGRRSDSRWLARVKVATRHEDDVSTPPGPMPDSLAEGGFSLFNVSQMEGRRALIARGDLTQGNYQQNHKLYIRFLEPKLEDSMIEESSGSINPSLKPDNTRFVYENNGVLYIHKLAGGGDIVQLTDGGQPDWGASRYAPGFGETGTTTTTTTTTGTTGADGGGGSTTTANDACGRTGISGTDYLLNGDFLQGDAYWQTVDIGKQGINSANLTPDRQCGQIIVFSRSGSGNDGGLIGLEQKLEVQIGNMSELRVRLTGFINSQDLSSDGWYGGEAPLFVQLDYQTAAGETKTWTHGLMVDGSSIKYPDRDTTIPQGQWTVWDSPNLPEIIHDAVLITKLTVGGSGWDFRSRVALVSLHGGTAR